MTFCLLPLPHTTHLACLTLYFPHPGPLPLHFLPHTPYCTLHALPFTCHLPLPCSYHLLPCLLAWFGGSGCFCLLCHHTFPWCMYTHHHTCCCFLLPALHTTTHLHTCLPAMCLWQLPLLLLLPACNTYYTCVALILCAAFSCPPHDSYMSTMPATCHLQCHFPAYLSTYHLPACHIPPPHMYACLFTHLPACMHLCIHTAHYHSPPPSRTPHTACHYLPAHLLLHSGGQF